MADENKTPNQPTGTPTPQNQADREAQADKQRKLADRLTIGPNTIAARTAALSTNSKLTTSAHVGKGAEPDKPDEQEALKVGAPNAGVDLRTSEISTHESGKATDTVVTQPVHEGALGAPELHKHDALGTARVRGEIAGEDGVVAPSGVKVVGGEQSTELSPGAGTHGEQHEHEAARLE